MAGYNPDYHLRPYSKYRGNDEGLKIELLYRKVGSKVWLKAFDRLGQPTVLLQINNHVPALVSFQVFFD